MLRVPLVASTGRAGYWSWFPVALVVVAVVQGRLGPSSWTVTSTACAVIGAALAFEYIPVVREL
jgi:hypothetical protein